MFRRNMSLPSSGSKNKKAINQHEACRLPFTNYTALHLRRQTSSCVTYILPKIYLQNLFTCGLASVVQWSEFLATDPEVPSSIPGDTRFSEKQWVWNGVHSAYWVQLRSYLKEKVAAPGLESREYSRRDLLCWPRDTLYPQKLALCSPTSGGRSVGIVRSRTKATECLWVGFVIYFGPGFTQQSLGLNSG
jgi:hypothetical protein